MAGYTTNQAPDHRRLKSGGWTEVGAAAASASIRAVTALEAEAAAPSAGPSVSPPLKRHARRDLRVSRRPDQHVGRCSGPDAVRRSRALQRPPLRIGYTGYADILPGCPQVSSRWCAARIPVPLCDVYAGHRSGFREAVFGDIAVSAMVVQER